MIGKNIRRIREEKGLTAKELGEMIDMTPHGITGLERGANTTLKTVEKIMNALDITWKDLVMEDYYGKSVAEYDYKRIEKENKELNELLDSGYAPKDIQGIDVEKLKKIQQDYFDSSSDDDYCITVKEILGCLAPKEEWDTDKSVRDIVREAKYPTPKDQVSDDIERDFNKFIREWTGDSYPHLSDSDGNDGERFREKLRILQANNKSLDTIANNYQSLYEKSQAKEKIAREALEEIANKKQRSEWNLLRVIAIKALISLDDVK